MSVLVLAEHNGQQLKQATRRAITAAQAWQMPVHLLVIGREGQAAVEDAAGIQGVAGVIKVEGPHLAHLLAEDGAVILADLAREHRVVLAPHTAFAKNIMPRAAALLNIGMISDVLRIEVPATYTRPLYAGNVWETVENTAAVQMLTVRASNFMPAGDGGRAAVTARPAPAPTSQARWVAETRNVSDRPELASARVVVSGGRPLGDQFDHLLSPLAARLQAALGATRAAVDAGFAPNDLQVGQTGTIVAPDLYIAIGVSGAIQHLAGMKDSKVIVAINHDPEAPIFQVADYGWVADLFKAVPELLEILGSI